MQIECREISLGYNNKKIVENLSFVVNKGNYICIVGENGVGKTTLMKSILGMVKPICGSIIRSSELEKSNIGYLTQSSDLQKDFPASVKEVVMSGFQQKCGFRPFYKKSEKLEAKNIMNRLGIDSLANKCFTQLSGGQKQRVKLSRALCATNGILFLDEPTLGLDSYVSSEMYEVIHELNVKDKVTILMITHDIECAITYATHILKIGEENFFGTKEEYLQLLKKSGKQVKGCTCI